MSGLQRAGRAAQRKSAQGPEVSARVADRAAGDGALAQLQAGSDASPAVQRLRGLQRLADDRKGSGTAPFGAAVQRMKVGGSAKASTVSGTTLAKHVKAAGDQEAAAKGNFGSTTFVRSASKLTAAVDANGHDFAASTRRSDREDINADVEIDQWVKKAQPGTPGFRAGGDVEKSIDNETHTCEIGAEKTGTNEISITHFKKL